MITIVNTKHLLESTTRAIVNFVDCSGQAVNFDGSKLFEMHPEMLNKFTKLCDENKFEPGMVWPYKATDRFILNFAVLENSNNWNSFNLETFKTGLEKLLQVAEKKNIPSIAISNIPQVADTDFKKIYDEAFYDKDLDVEVYIYNLLCDTAPEQIEVIEKPIFEKHNQSPDKNSEHKTESNKVSHMTYPKNTIFNI